MPRIVSGSLLVLSLVLVWGLTRPGLAQQADVPEQGEDESASPAAATPDARKSSAATDDKPAAAGAVEEGSTTKPSVTKSETKDDRPSQPGAAPAASDPQAPRPGSLRDQRGNRGPADDPKRVVSDFTGAEKPAAGEDKESKAEPRLTFNFRFAPWKTVLERFAEVAKLNLDMDEPPPGTFNYYDKSTYSVKDALDIINGYLIQKGYILVRRDRFLVVANFGRGPVPPNLIPTVPLADLPNRGRNEYVSVVIPLANIDAKTASEEIKDLLGPYPQGKAIPMVASNKLIITDLASHVQAIFEVLEGMGKVTAENKPTIRSFKLIHVSATEAERMLRDLFALPSRGATGRTSSSDQQQQQAATRFGRQNTNGDDGSFRGRGRGRDSGGGGFPRFGGGFPGSGDAGAGGENAGMDPQAMFQAMMMRGRDRGGRGEGGESSDRPAANRLTLTIDPRQNTLLVTCSVEDMRLVEEAIKTIDVAVTTDPRGDYLRGDNVPQLEVYPLESADPAVVAEILYITVPGSIVREDAKARGVIVYATRTEQEQVRNLVKQLDSAISDSIASLRLRHWDAAAAATSLRALFSNNKVDPPSIEADSVGRRLMVRGTPDQVSQIKRLLAEMGEDGSVPTASTAGTGPVRSILPQGRSAAEILAIVKQLYPATENSYIRIVDPSAIGVPSFQPRQIDEPRRGGSSQFRRMAPPIGQEPADDEAPRFQRNFERNSEADPEAGGKPSTMKRKSDARRFPFAAYRDLQPASAERPSTRNRTPTIPEAEAAPVAKPDDKAGIEELARQLEESLRDQDESQQADGSQEPAEPAEPAAAPQTGAERAPSSELRMTVLGDRILMASTDMQALDRMEKLIQALSTAAPPKTKWTVYYLRVADATETATMLGNLFPEGTVARTTQTTGGLFGGGLFSRFNNGSNESTGLSSLSKAQLRIIPEVRSNALFISGDEHEVDQVMEALRVLDSSELPESLKDRVPRMIAVEHADVVEVAAIVRDVYKEQMDGGIQQAQQGGNRGGMGGFPGVFGGGFGQQQQQQPGRGGRVVQLSIGVDTRTNQLIVSASDSLYRQVDALVKSLDDSANQARRTVRVLSLQNSNSEVVQQTLAALYGKVKTSAPRGGRTTAAPPNSQQPGQPPAGQTPGQAPNGNTNQQNDSPNVDPAAFFMQQQMMRNMMRGGGFGGGRGGGGRGGGFGGGQGGN